MAKTQRRHPGHEIPAVQQDAWSPFRVIVLLDPGRRLVWLQALWCRHR